MALISKFNQYFGVNAHANGWMQISHEWRPFHARHIIDLTDAINEALPDGYIAVPESSLQIEQVDPDIAEFPNRRSPRPDTSIFDVNSRTSTGTPSGLAVVGLLVRTTQTIYRTETELNAAVIYKTEEHPRYGRPVARLELLSPTNKPPQPGALAYEQSRIGALTSGIPLVEIDYLHQQPSVNAAIPLYPDAHGSQPYSITIHDPRPTLAEGTSDVILFGIDDPIPAIRIPLASGDVTGRIDLNAAYNKSFTGSVQLHRQADYAQEPIDYVTYSPADQRRISQRMRIVQAADARNLSLTQGPLPRDFE